MENINITLKMNDLENMDIINRNYSKMAARIILHKIPKNLLNNLIEQIGNKEVMNSHSL